MNHDPGRGCVALALLGCCQQEEPAETPPVECLDETPECGWDCSVDGNGICGPVEVTE